MLHAAATPGEVVDSDQQDATMTPTAIVSTLFDRLEQAWNAADGGAFAAAFTNDCDFVDIRGTHHQGAPSVAHGQEAIFDSIYAGSVIRYRVGSARLGGSRPAASSPPRRPHSTRPAAPRRGSTTLR